MVGAIDSFITDVTSIIRSYTRVRETPGVDILPDTTVRCLCISIKSFGLSATKSTRKFSSFGKTLILMTKFAGITA